MMAGMGQITALDPETGAELSFPTVEARNNWIQRRLKETGQGGGGWDQGELEAYARSQGLTITNRPDPALAELRAINEGGPRKPRIGKEPAFKGYSSSTSAPRASAAPTAAAPTGGKSPLHDPIGWAAQQRLAQMGPDPAAAPPGATPPGATPATGGGGGGGGGVSPMAALIGKRLSPELEELYLTDPDAFRSAVEVDRLQGKRTDEEAAGLEQRLDQPTSITDLNASVARNQLEGARLQAQARAQEAQFVADEQADYARKAEEAMAFEREETEKARLRLEAQSRGERVFQERSMEADRKLEDYRIKDRRTGGQVVMDMFSLALGQFASQLTRDPSIAQNVANAFEKRMDRQFAAQEAELQKRQGKVARVRSDLAAFREGYQNTEAAHAALRSRYYSEAAQSMRATAAYYGNKRAVAAGESIAAEMENRAEQFKNQAKLSFAQNELQMLAGAQRAPVPQGPPGYVTATDEKMGNLYLEHFGVFIPNETRFNQISQGLENSRAALSTVDELIALAGLPGSKITPELKASIQAAKGRGISQISVAQKQGAVSGDDGERAVNQLGAGIDEILSGDTVTGSALAALKNTRAALIQGEQTAIKSAGGIRGFRQPIRKKDGGFGWQVTVEDPAQQQQIQQQQQQVQQQQTRKGLETLAK
jgi:hypothetical protein